MFQTRKRKVFSPKDKEAMWETEVEIFYHGWRVLLGKHAIQYIPRNMHAVFALLCFVVVIHWLIFPYPSGLLHWHCGNLTIAPVPAKQPWWIWINTTCEFIKNYNITTTKQSTTKPCAYFLGYTVPCNPRREVFMFQTRKRKVFSPKDKEAMWETEVEIFYHGWRVLLGKDAMYRPYNIKTIYSISQEICTRFCCALLCCGYAIVHNEFTWSIYPYSSGLLCWHWGNR